MDMYTVWAFFAFCLLTIAVCFVVFLKQELLELQESLSETSVIVQMDNSRGLNMDKIVADAKAQYEDIAAHSREEAENWYRSKVRS